MRTAGSFWRACIFVLVSTMKVIKVFFLFILLGGDYGLELASLEAFPTQAYEVDGRANLLFAPVSPLSSILHWWDCVSCCDCVSTWQSCVGLRRSWTAHTYSSVQNVDQLSSVSIATASSYTGSLYRSTRHY